jgi:hypothetical protein
MHRHALCFATNLRQQRRQMRMRTKMYAVALIASIMAPFGALSIPDNLLLSGARVFSFNARAAEAIRGRSNACRWNNVGWQDMSEEERGAWRTLGWTGQMWESDGSVQAASDSKAWTDLSQNERAAARRLGYTHNTWDADKCGNR